MVNSRYSAQTPSGENIAATAQFQALLESGLDVRLLERKTPNTDRRLDVRHITTSTIHVLTGLETSPQLSAIQAEYEDVLFIQNLFPNFGWRWLRRWPGPVVTMIHNFRFTCINGYQNRNQQPCNLCLNRFPTPAIKHACYRDSRLASLPVALGNAYATKRHPALAKATRVIAQTPYTQELLHICGVSPARTAYCPGFVDNPDIPVHTPDQPWTFVGRLSREKGLLHLLGVWPSHERLNVIGTGPDFDQCLLIASQGIDFRGQLDNSAIFPAVARSNGLLYPSVFHEGAIPLTVREALMVGTPVIAAAGSSVAALVERESLGAVFDLRSKNSLQSALDKASSFQLSDRERIQAFAQDEFSRQTWVLRMTKILADAVAQHAHGQ